MKFILVLAISITVRCVASDILFINSDTTKVLHSPTIDLKGNILFGKSNPMSDGWFIDNTEWLLINYNQNVSQNIPIKSDHAFLSTTGKNIVFSGDDGLIYIYNITTGETKPISTSHYVLPDSTSETLVNPLISANSRYIYSRSTYYEFYYEGAILFRLSNSDRYLRQHMSGEDVLPCNYAYFTIDNKYLVTCGENIGSERPTGLLIFDLTTDSIKINSSKADFMCCVFREEENVVYGLKHSFDSESNYKLEKYSVETGIIQEKMILDEKLKDQVFHFEYPLLAYINESNELIFLDYIKDNQYTVDILDNLSFLAHWSRMVWDLSDRVLIIATDKYLKIYKMK